MGGGPIRAFGPSRHCPLGQNQDDPQEYPNIYQYDHLSSMGVLGKQKKLEASGDKEILKPYF